MRNPNRIDRILKKLKTIWKENPDWRLGQLILNFAGEDNFLYYVEDDIMEKILDKYIKDTLGL